MSQLMDLISEADTVAIALEQAKQKLELAKLTLEAAKLEVDRVRSAYEEVLSRAEANGIAKSKLKKLVEERVLGLAGLGLAEWGQGSSTAVEKSKKPRTVKKTSKDVATEKTTQDVQMMDTDLVNNTELITEMEPVSAEH